MALVTNKSEGAKGVHVVGSRYHAMLAPGETRELELLNADHPVIRAWVADGHIEIVHPEVVETDDENGEPDEQESDEEEGEPCPDQTAKPARSRRQKS